MFYFNFRYCNREFDDEKILIQHQKAKHFKCHICHKKLYTGPGLAIHCMQVHKETIDKIPNALPNRNNVDIEIYGMEGIPDADLKEHERSKGSEGYISSEAMKKQQPTNPAVVVAAATGIIPPSAVGIPTGSGVSHGPPGFVGVIPGLPVAGLPYALTPASNPGQQFPGFPVPPQVPPYGATIPPPPSLAPPHTIVSSASALQSSIHQQRQAINIPQKPLFPSVSNALTGGGTTVVGADFKPLSGSSSGYGGGTSGTATVSASAIISKPASASSTTSSSSTIILSGGTSKIIHPDEDVSLEEIRARSSKYRMMIPHHATSLNGINTNTNPNPNQAVYSTPAPGGHPGGHPGAHLLVHPPHHSIPQLSMPHHPSFQSTFRPAY